MKKIGINIGVFLIYMSLITTITAAMNGQLNKIIAYIASMILLGGTFRAIDLSDKNLPHD